MESDFELLKEELILSVADVQWVNTGKSGMRRFRKEEAELLKYSSEMSENRKRELADALARAQKQLVSNYYAHALRAMEDKLLTKAAHYLAKSAEAGCEFGGGAYFPTTIGTSEYGISGYFSVRSGNSRNARS